MNTSSYKLITLLLVIAIIISSLWTFDLQDFFHPEKVQQYILHLGPYGPLAFIGIYILTTVTFLPAAPFTMLGGAIFGPIEGALYTTIGATIGATFAFLISRILGEGYVHNILKKRFPTIHKYDEKLRTRGFWAVLILRILPLIPFNGLNFLLGLTRVRLISYIGATTIGILPVVLIYSYLGSSVASIDIPQIIFALTLIIILGVTVNYIVKRFAPQSFQKKDRTSCGNTQEDN